MTLSSGWSKRHAKGNEPNEITRSVSKAYAADILAGKRCPHPRDGPQSNGPFGFLLSGFIRRHVAILTNLAATATTARQTRLLYAKPVLDRFRRASSKPTCHDEIADLLQQLIQRALLQAD